ncbi:hypothetical protein OSTOST_02589, partial [Ostertagia ostertagi]
MSWDEKYNGKRRATTRRDTLQLSNRVRYVRRLRFRVYYFLDHPMSANSTWYHFGVFGVVLIAVILGATTTWEDPLIREVHFYMEVTLAVFFICEFCVRMWCISADAKYCGIKDTATFPHRSTNDDMASHQEHGHTKQV